MARGPKVGLIVPRFEEFAEFYQAADQMGFHSLAVTEMRFNRAWTGTRGLDPFWRPDCRYRRNFAHTLADSGVVADEASNIVLCL